MLITTVNISKTQALDLTRFKEMDYFAVENYGLPIELMMENAGLQLANLIANSTDSTDAVIQIGIGNGNNGGGGLVAARRLAAWGFKVHLDLSTKIDKELPLKQLERAQKFGVQVSSTDHPDIWVDAYLGFSQRLPLSSFLLERIALINNSSCLRISLDIPTGFLGDLAKPYFQAHKVLSLAAAKKILYQLPQESEIYIADLGIPDKVYQQFGITAPPFHQSNILKLENLV